MIEQTKSLLLITLGLSVFEIINLINLEQTNTLFGSINNGLILLLPQLIGFVLFTYGLGLGYKSFNNIWVLTLIQINIGLVTKMVFRYIFTAQQITKNTLIGFVFCLIGLVISKC